MLLFFRLAFLATAFLRAGQLCGWAKVAVKTNHVTYVMKAMRAMTLDVWDWPTILTGVWVAGVMLAALKADGFPLPSGLKDEDAPAVRPPTPRAGEGKTPERGPLAQSGTGARPGVVGRTGEPLRHPVSTVREKPCASLPSSRNPR